MGKNAWFYKLQQFQIRLQAFQENTFIKQIKTINFIQGLQITQTFNTNPMMNNPQAHQQINQILFNTNYQKQLYEVTKKFQAISIEISQFNQMIEKMPSITQEEILQFQKIYDRFEQEISFYKQKHTSLIADYENYIQSNNYQTQQLCHKKTQNFIQSLNNTIQLQKNNTIKSDRRENISQRDQFDQIQQQPKFKVFYSQIINYNHYFQYSNIQINRTYSLQASEQNINKIYPQTQDFKPILDINCRNQHKENDQKIQINNQQSYIGNEKINLYIKPILVFQQGEKQNIKSSQYLNEEYASKPQIDSSFQQQQKQLKIIIQNQLKTVFDQKVDSSKIKKLAQRISKQFQQSDTFLALIIIGQPGVGKTIRINGFSGLALGYTNDKVESSNNIAKNCKNLIKNHLFEQIVQSINKIKQKYSSITHQSVQIQKLIKLLQKHHCLFLKLLQQNQSQFESIPEQIKKQLVLFYEIIKKQKQKMEKVSQNNIKICKIPFNILNQLQKELLINNNKITLQTQKALQRYFQLQAKSIDFTVLDRLQVNLQRNINFFNDTKFKNLQKDNWFLKETSKLYSTTIKELAQKQNKNIQQQLQFYKNQLVKQNPVQTFKFQQFFSKQSKQTERAQRIKKILSFYLKFQIFFKQEIKQIKEIVQNFIQQEQQNIILGMDRLCAYLKKLNQKQLHQIKQFRSILRNAKISRQCYQAFQQLNKLQNINKKVRNQFIQRFDNLIHQIKEAIRQKYINTSEWSFQDSLVSDTAEKIVQRIQQNEKDLKIIQFFAEIFFQKQEISDQVIQVIQKKNQAQFNDFQRKTIQEIQKCFQQNSPFQSLKIRKYYDFVNVFNSAKFLIFPPSMKISNNVKEFLVNKFKFNCQKIQAFVNDKKKIQEFKRLNNGQTQFSKQQKQDIQEINIKINRAQKNEQISLQNQQIYFLSDGLNVQSIYKISSNSQVNNKFIQQKDKLIKSADRIYSLEFQKEKTIQLINCDNLQMPIQLLKSHNNQYRENNIKVIAIIGSQSSDKITLLNFLSGCDFFSSQGRCTTGVHSTYYQIQQIIQKVKRQYQANNFSKINHLNSKKQKYIQQIIKKYISNKQKQNSIITKFVYQNFAMDLIINKRARFYYGCQQEIKNYPIKIQTVLEKIQQNYGQKFIKYLYNFLKNNQLQSSHQLLDEQNIFKAYQTRLSLEQIKKKQLFTLLNQIQSNQNQNPNQSHKAVKLQNLQVQNISKNNLISHVTQHHQPKNLIGSASSKSTFLTVEINKDYMNQLSPRTYKSLLALNKSFYQQIKDAKNKCQTPSQYQQQKKKILSIYIQRIKTMNFQTTTTRENLKKKNICFLAPTSVGKTTVGNQLFGTNYEIGLLDTTKKATVMKQQQNRVFWDAPGINTDFSFIQPKSLGFFQSLSTAVILYDRDIQDINLIVDLISQLVPEVIYARTKCDIWKQRVQSIDEQLRVDLAEIRKIDPKAKEVIAIGYGMYDEIKARLKI